MGNFLGYQLHMQWYDYMRVCTAILLLIALYGSSRRASKLWPTYTERLRELWWVFNAALLFIAEGAIEQILLDGDNGPRVVLNFILSLAAIKAVYRPGGYIKTEEASSD